VTNRNDGTVSVIGLDTLTVTEVIAGFDNPWDMVVSPTDPRAYVSNNRTDEDGDSVDVIDTMTDSLVDTWPIPGSWHLAGLDVSPDGNRLYVVDPRRGYVYVMSTSTGQVLDEVYVGMGDERQGGWEVEVFPAEAGPYAYITVPDDDLVRVIDTGNNTVVRTIQTSNGPRGLALFPPSRVREMRVWYYLPLVTRLYP
jgi:YVTN family beta-propeller protein